MLSLRGTDSRTLALFDGIALFWLVFWLVIAILTGVQVWSLSGLSDSAQLSASAADQAGQALQGLGQIPVIGEEPARLGTAVREAAADVDANAQQTREDVRRLSVLLGVAIFLIPSSPVLGFYLPARLRRRREVTALRRHLDGTPDPGLDAWLAHRAVHEMTYGQLRQVSDDPARDLAEGRHRALAAAELRRLGLAPSVRR